MAREAGGIPVTILISGNCPTPYAGSGLHARQMLVCVVCLCVPVDVNVPLPLEGFPNCCYIILHRPSHESPPLLIIDVATCFPGLIVSLFGQEMEIPWVNRTILLAQLIGPSPISRVPNAVTWKAEVWSIWKDITLWK